MRWLGSIAAVLILVVAVAIWRLMQGPIALDWLLPYVQEGLTQAGIGPGVKISGVRLGIDRTTHQLDLRVEDVHVTTSTGEKLANFPEMATSLSLGSLMRGRLSPTQVTIERPVVQLRRDKDGVISFRVGDKGEMGYDQGLALVASLVGPARADAPLGQLARLQIHDATVTVDDEMFGRRWQAEHLDAAIQRDAEGSTGQLSLAAAIGSQVSQLRATYRYTDSRRKLDLVLSADDVEPNVLAPLSPALLPLADFHVPVSGSLATQFSFDEGKFEGIRVDLGIGAGWLASTQFPGGRLAVKSGELHAVYAPEHKQVRLDRLALDLGDGALLVIGGHLDGITRGLVNTGATAYHNLPARLDLTLTNVPIARFGALWPYALNPASRHWVLANIRDGALDQATAQLDFTIDPETRAVSVISALGSLKYHDLAINYLDGLPLVTHVGGTATANANEIDFIPSSGGIKSLKVTGGVVKATNLSDKDQFLWIDINVAGQLRDALDILDAKPLHYAHEAGIDPATVSGRVETQLHFKVPIEFSLKLDDVDYAAKATLTGAGIARAAFGRDLADGSLALDLAKSGVQIKGHARFDDVPTTIEATIATHAKAAARAVYRIGLTLDDAARRRLDWDIAPERVSGPVGIDLTYSLRDPTHAGAAVALDLRAARLAMPEAGWEKAAGQPARATLDFDLERQTVTGPLRITAQAAGLDGRLAVTMSPDRDRADRVDISRLVVGNDDLARAVTRANGGWRADINARRIDLRPVLKHALAGSNGPPPVPLTIAARIDRVEFGPRRALTAVSAELSRTGAVWQTMRIDGSYANGRRLALRVRSDTGPRKLTVASDDLGSALRLLDIADNVVGGRMTLTGQFTEAGGKTVLRGEITGSDYSVVRAPAITQVLSLASFSGLSGMLAGSGIPFGSLRGKFTYSDDRVVLDKLLASGELLGITASGTVDLGHDTLDLTGTVAPAHALNSVFGKVPVLGPLLMGGEGQSLFAANYALNGATADPSVSVNPLSAIAPGFLRLIFSPIPDSGEEPPQPP